MRKNSTSSPHHNPLQEPQHKARSVFLEARKAQRPQTTTIPHGDGRIRTDDPLLAKQVLSH